MKNLMLKNLFLLSTGIFVFFLVVGCNKQKSTLQEIPQRDTTTRAPDFSGVDTTGGADLREANLTEELAKKAKDALQPVYFAYNSSQLDPIAVERLVIVAAFLKNNPGLRILVTGHCDERGSSEYNLGLGEGRSDAVKRYLANYGIQSIRLETSSMGKEQPAIPNCGGDESCHAKNRRAEFMVLAK